MAKTSLSELFKRQIKAQDRVTGIKILKTFRRIERMVDDMSQYSLDVGKMTMRVKVGGGLAVVVMVLPRENKLIIKKIIRV